MDIKQIKSMGKELNKFLAKFDDCFSRSESRQNLRTYIKGQLSDLPRKSIEPIALAANVKPRTLQNFLSAIPWDQDRMLEKLQWMIAKDHAHPDAIGIIDESGNPKKGAHTACVKRQWCGNSGKIDNCVVGVHTAYVAGDFQCILDGDLFLPEDWANDPVRREEAGIPEDVVYRKKAKIALDQVARAISNGIRVSAWTCDEFYGRDGEFLDGLDKLGQNYVAQVPANFTGWLYEPEILHRPTPQQMRKRGRKRRFPRLSAKALPASEVQNLLTYSRTFQKQKWQKFHIKDGEKGPYVWEVKHSIFYRKHPDDGLPGKAHYLIIARNVLNRQEIKYFVSNMVPAADGISLEKLLWIAFCRAPIEQCFERCKQQFGMDHFEVRGWMGIHRHFYITQLSFLFCSVIHHNLREKKDRQFLSDSRTGSPGHLCMFGGSAISNFGQKDILSGGFCFDFVLPKTQSAGSKVSSKEDALQASKAWHKNKSVEILCTA
ncbi:MAG: IS701 family transposase [Planctomycetota bacterium]